MTSLSAENLLENLKKILERIETLKEKIVEIKGTGFSDPVPSSLADLSNLSGGNIQNLANKTLDEILTGSWTCTSPTTFSTIKGPSNNILLINSRSHGVEINIDENSTGSGSFVISKGSTGQSLLVLKSNSGNLGMGTTFPSEKIHVVGNVKANQFISTVPTGTAPLQVSSITKIDNLNADLLDGFHASISPEPHTVVVRDDFGQIADGFSFSNFQIRRYYGYIENSSTNGEWAKIATLSFPNDSNTNGTFIIFKISRDSDTYSYLTQVSIFIDYVNNGTKKRLFHWSL